MTCKRNVFEATYVFERREKEKHFMQNLWLTAQKIKMAYYVEIIYIVSYWQYVLFGMPMNCYYIFLYNIV